MVLDFPPYLTMTQEWARRSGTEMLLAGGHRHHLCTDLGGRKRKLTFFGG